MARVSCEEALYEQIVTEVLRQAHAPAQMLLQPGAGRLSSGD
ncbi:MAG TPA: hypothetical protein VGO48_14970 [Conexibacter sp.]|nr:hypothetical protein [Conexibacter sp.]